MVKPRVRYTKPYELIYFGGTEEEIPYKTQTDRQTDIAS